MSEHITLEEAAEIVLKGPVYETCPHCENGFVGPVHKMGSDGTHSSALYLRKTCPTCMGHGNYLQPLYCFACGMTSTPIPERRIGQAGDQLPILWAADQQRKWAEDYECQRHLDDARRSG